VALLETVVLLDVVQVVAADDSRALRVSHDVIMRSLWRTHHHMLEYINTRLASPWLCVA
jgi:hypothetical protein